MRKVLIADSSEEFRLALADCLKSRYTVQTCHEGKQTLQLLRTLKPDVLVLDLMLPGLDGISLLQEAAREGIHPMVLAISGFVSEYVLECVEQMNVEYLMVKPCEVKATAARVADLARQLKTPAVSRPEPHTIVTNILLELGVPTKLKGYACLREAILEMMRDPGQPVTKELYPRVGKRCDANAVQVERLIRCAIEAAWKRRDEDLWQEYFRCGSGEQPERPTNAAFISGIANRIANGNAQPERHRQILPKNRQNF